ncbi:hypothetical protein [Ilumatobacter coccineus]|uniref:Uncharacterized protein n=1 Tax=Ilumatobacter coccineus (strain NBRC 103263 / KCTC 29153 / YM16-304) TaxID=1313172 RepID=A0A6C7E027_ILUCY|nr:hypothetical protein [Ilumatobacter coccineus]BAN01664.1 hypothetical protein YM304_13500 [Ilumatobacter coccineus YM16-304]
MVQQLLERPVLHRASDALRGAILLFPIRIFLGFGWLRAGIEKFIDADWWTGDKLRQFLDVQRETALPFMGPLIDDLFAPLAGVIAVAVMIGQLAIGVCFVTTRWLRPALWAAITLNVVFVAMGAVDPSVFYLVIELSLLAALALGVIGGRPRRPNPSSVGAKVGVAIAMLPFVDTVHPAEVIHDPAIILVTVAMLGAATEALGWLHRPSVTSSAPDWRDGDHDDSELRARV